MARVHQASLVITAVDQTSGVLGKVKKSLADLTATVKQANATPFRMMAQEAKRFHHEVRAGADASRQAISGLIQQTQEFKEQEWGFAFARIPDFIDGAVIKTKEWRAEQKAVSAEAREVAMAYGMLPTAVMKARTEVQKIGLEGDAGKSLFHAALGLNMADPELTTDLGVKYLGAMFRSYADQRKIEIAAIAKEGGHALDDKGGFADPKMQAAYEEQWLRGLAAKSAFAAAKSALGPKDLVEGARQYAPVWASLGMSPDQVLGSLAHGSNYGFMAPELGTAFKSWANRLVKPTQGGVRWMNSLGIDRSKFVDGLGAKDPAKATMDLNSLLGNQLYAGKGGNDFKIQIRAMLDKAQRAGTTDSAEFQGKLAAAIQQKLGPGWAGREQDIAEAVQHATLTATGNVDIMAFIKEALAKNMPKAAMLEILEGRHVARNTPMFKYFDALTEMIAGLQKIQAPHLDAIVQGRKEDDAAKLIRLQGAWENLIISVSKSGAIDALTNSLITLANAINGLPPGVIEKLTYGLVGLAAVGVAAVALGGLARALSAVRVGLSLLAPLAVLAARFSGIADGARLARVAVLGLGAALAAKALRGTVGIGTPDALNPGRPTAAAAINQQRGILAKAWEKAKAGGRLAVGAAGVYSVYEIVSWLLGGSKAAADTPADAAEQKAAEAFAARLGIVPTDKGADSKPLWRKGLVEDLNRTHALTRMSDADLGGAMNGDLTTDLAIVAEQQRRKRKATVEAWYGAQFGAQGTYGTKAVTAADLPGIGRAITAPQATLGPGDRVREDRAAVEGRAGATANSAATASISQARQRLAAEDWTPEGVRLAESIATGIRQGASSIVDSINAAVGEATRRAVREAYTDGGTR
jgi:hypothetical protein